MTTAIASTPVAPSPAFNPITESRLSVKAVKMLHGIEGSGFRCKVYFDGVFAGEAQDNADGGPVQLYPVSADMFANIHGYLGSLPKMPFHGFDLDITLDIAIVGLVQAASISKALARAHKKSFCIARSDTRFGSYLHVPCLTSEVDATIAAFDKEFGTGQWLMLANPRDGVLMPAEYYSARAA
jgi:hypothetical protein